MLPRPAHHFTLARLRAALQAQRGGLELRKPWAWPLVPQLVLLVLVSALVLGLVNTLIRPVDGMAKRKEEH